MIKKKKMLHSFLEQIGKDMTQHFDERHMATILHGGIVLGEFSPQYSDIDLVIVVEKMEEEDGFALRSVWKHWADHEFGDKPWIHVMPLSSLAGGKSQGWTISQKGLLPFNRFPLDDLELYTLTRYGKTIKGKDLLDSFPTTSSDYRIRGLVTFFRILQRYSSLSPMQPIRESSMPNEDEIGLLLTFPRHLYNLYTNQVTTKCQAARWYAKTHEPYSMVMAEVADFRMNPDPKRIKEMEAIMDKIPQITTHFWNLYFKQLNIDVTVPHPITKPMEVDYRMTFRAIHDGLRRMHQQKEII